MGNSTILQNKKHKTHIKKLRLKFLFIFLIKKALCIGLMLFCTANVLHAVPYYSLLVDENSSSGSFATELSRLWHTSGLVKSSKIVINNVPSAKDRLERLVSRQGDLAVLDGASAYRYLKDYPQLRVISVLWPDVLHIISKTAYRPRLMDGDLVSMKIHENSLHFSEFWTSLNRLSKQTPTIWFRPTSSWNEEPSAINSQNNTAPFFTPFNEDILVSSSVYPLPEVAQLLEQNFSMQMIPLETALLTAYQNRFPWTRIHVLPAGTYSNQRRSLSLPASFPVLVVRNGAPRVLVTTTLRILFSQRKAMQPHILFKQIKPEHNLLFRQNFRYHYSARQRFRFR